MQSCRSGIRRCGWSWASSDHGQLVSTVARNFRTRNPTPCTSPECLLHKLHVTRQGDFMPHPADKTSKKATRDKVRAHRERLRKQGLRPIQIWVPDVNSPEFVAEAHRQSLAIAKSPREKDDQAFIDSISNGIWDGE